MTWKLYNVRERVPISGQLLLCIWIAFGFCKNEPELHCEAFELQSNTALITVEVNGRQQKLSMDSGIEKSQISDPLFFGQTQSGNENPKKAIIESPFFTGSQDFEYIASTKPNLLNCAESIDKAGAMGYDFLKGRKKMLFDFDRSMICALSDAETMSARSKANYTEVKSNFKSNSLSIYATINRKEFAFVFDTGFSGTFEMEYKTGLPFLKENHETIEEVTFDNQKNKEITAFIYTKNILFNGIYYTAVFPVSERIQRQRIGMGFIKGFNWIIDFENRKVFVKKNTKSIDKGIALQEYQTETRNMQLIVCKRNADRKKYALGTSITSVNGEKITPESLCKFKDLLNKSASWNLLDIETEPDRK